MKKAVTIILIALILVIVYSNNRERKDSIAPACEGRGGITGCLGKSGIKDIKVEPMMECLNIRANNCNGGILGIENKCDFDLALNNIVISADSYKGIEFARDKRGDVFVLAPKGNFDSYNPVYEDTLSANGMLGGQQLTITYTKKNVCGESKYP